MSPSLVLSHSHTISTRPDMTSRHQLALDLHSSARMWIYCIAPSPKPAWYVPSLYIVYLYSAISLMTRRLILVIHVLARSNFIVSLQFSKSYVRYCYSHYISIHLPSPGIQLGIRKGRKPANPLHKDFPPPGHLARASCLYKGFRKLLDFGLTNGLLEENHCIVILSRSGSSLP